MVRHWAQCRRFARVLVVAGLALALASPTRADKTEDPFKTPRAQVIAIVKTVGVMPLIVADVVPNAAAVTKWYEGEVVRRLEAAGFSVVPPTAMREIREPLRQASGGLYNPMDGAPIVEKIRQFQEDSRKAYQAAHPVDAYLDIAIAVRGAETSADVAEWDGVKENSNGKSGLAGFFTGGTTSGTTPALSFVVTLRDPSDHVLYHKAGGLQLLQYVYVGYIKTSQRTIDPQYILSDPHRDARAIALALDPLTGAVSPEATAKVDQLPDAAPKKPAEGRSDTHEPLARKYPRLLLTPVHMVTLPQQAAARERLDRELEQSLTADGFTVVRADDYEAAWKAERERVGGFYDAMSGEFDAEKLKASRQAVFAQVAAGKNVQAIVYPIVMVRAVPFAQGEAHWDGVEERAFTAKSALGMVFNMSRTLVGHLNALSLEIRIADEHDATVLSASGGLQLLEKIESGARTAVPESDVLSDVKRDQVAIDLALRGLAPAEKQH